MSERTKRDRRTDEIAVQAMRDGPVVTALRIQELLEKNQQLKERNAELKEQNKRLISRGMVQRILNGLDDVRS